MEIGEEPIALALTGRSTEEKNATPSADSVYPIIYIQDTQTEPQTDENHKNHNTSSNPIEISSRSSSVSTIEQRNSSSSSSSEKGEEVVFNQNYDEQSDSSFSAWDQDDLFDDDEDEDDQFDGAAGTGGKELRLDEHNSQNDEFDDEYEDEYDVDPKARHPDSDQPSISIPNSSGIGSDDSFRNDDTKASSVIFGTRRKPTTKLGSNDAIKFVETPHGKAGFVYQAPSVTGNTKDDFVPRKKGDASLQNSSTDVKQRITPVLTADGKVALLYRGAVDSGSTGKYEPIRNFTNFDENKAETVATTTIVAEVTTISTTTTTTVTASTTVLSFIESAIPDNTEENALLPNINKPLSEVLGVKKNQFTQFRIKDQEVPSVTPPFSHGDHTSNRIPEMSDFELESHSEEEQSQIMTPPRSNHVSPVDEDDDEDTSSFSDALSKTEVVNLAIIPAFDSDLAAIQEHEDRRAAEEEASANGDPNSRGHYRSRQNHRRNMEDLSAIHCAMQAMVAIAAMATVFGMLGAYFKTRVLDQITIMHWWEMVGVRYWVGFSRRGGVIL